MTLKTLQIKNFQCHEKLQIEFDPRITTIIGSSDRGKSAIVRALKWVCQNNPQGEAFIKDGTKGTTVRLFVDDHVITRKRGSGKNLYLLDKKAFKAFGTDVPDPIKNILNVDDITWALQHDAPFWFSLTAGEVSRQLNSIVDLGIIDKSLAAIGKKVRYIQQSITICKERLTKAKERKEDIDWIVETDLAYTLVEKYQEKHEDLHHEALDLKDLIQSSSESIRVRDRASSQARDIQSVGKLGQICLSKSKSKVELFTLLKTIKNQKKIIEEGIPNFGKISDSYWICMDVSTNNESLKILIQNYKSWSDEIYLRKEHLKRVEEELHEATEGKCPVCGKEM